MLSRVVENTSICILNNGNILREVIVKIGLGKINIVRHGSHWGGSPQNRLRDEQTCGTTLSSAYVLRCLSATWSQLQMNVMKSKIGVSADWCVTVEHQRSSSIRVYFY